MRDLESLRARNLALGGHLDNAIVLDDSKDFWAYNYGLFDFDAATVILGNHASTNHNNVGP